MNNWRKRADFRQKWHEAVNRFNTGIPHRHWMYEAMDASGEVERLQRIFAMERRGELPKIHQHCSFSAPVELPKNFLTCCLGVKCAECPELQSLNQAELTEEQKDTAKAWTCVAHILMSGGDNAREGYILDESDKLFWQETYASLAQEK